jgi:hypothetical protein
MKRDYRFVSEYCVIIIQDCDTSEMAEDRLAEIVKHPKRFRLDSVEDDEQLQEWEAEIV